MRNKKFREFKRVIYIFIIFCLIFGMTGIKILDIQRGAYSLVADVQFSKVQTIGETRGYIYDRNFNPLVNCNKKEKYVVLVNPANKLFLSDYLGIELNDGVCLEIDSKGNLTETEFMKKYYKIERYSDEDLCVHITGYVNSDGTGICGIEKAFDKILSDAKGKLQIKYDKSGNDKALAGSGIVMENSGYDSPAGVVLTIDKNIQRITENSMKNSKIICGAAVIINVDTFEIEAVCSVPSYKQNDVAASLSDSNLPFVNRAFSAYPVGSVFKPVVAASALENGLDFYEIFDCKGYLKINGNIFRCFNTNAHGKTDLNAAIEKSCNCYFMNIGINTGAQKIISTAQDLGFGKKTDFCSTLQSSSGNLCNAQSITSDAQLANLCFGQGDLLATPVQLATAYAVLANGGYYKEPVLLKELVDENREVYAYYKPDKFNDVIKKETCDIINVCLHNNMLNGTGVNASPCNTTAAGKTATAQTGKFDEDGNEILCTWFVGFFPYEKPQYAVAIINENGSTASSDCAPVFKSIAEGITDYLETR